MRCWGANNSGQLGNGTTTSSSVPVPVSGITNATAIAAGRFHTCASLADGTVRCWGSNLWGNLGNGTTNDSSTPVPVSGITDATGVATAAYTSCALLADGTARCWGNDFGNLLASPGTATVGYSAVPAGPATGLPAATAISGGGGHFCALVADAGIWCWGDNSFAQATGFFGNATLPHGPVLTTGFPPIVVPATDVSAGDNHTCAVMSNATVGCWGNNTYGQLGPENLDFNASTPVPVPAITTAVDVVAGYRRSCAALADGTVRCWGNNTGGQLGDGTTTSSATPVVVSGISNATAVAAGQSSVCALGADGTVSCWGSNSSGQLGNGTTAGSSVPVAVTGIG